MEEKKKRGRPALSEEERKKSEEIRRIKMRGYSKKFREQHPEKSQQDNERKKQLYYTPKLFVPIENKGALKALLDKTGLSVTRLCFVAIEETYGVSLQKGLDKDL